MRLLVVGGSGFVGTRVVRTALAQGVHVASISRSGKPIAGAADLTGVEWLKGDVVAGGEALHSALSDCDAVISCLGAFGSNEFMHQVNGTANAALAEASAKAGVDRFAFISASAIRPVAKAMAAAGYEGYYAGKLTAEEAVKRHFGSAGLILRPGPIYGTRAVSPNISVPIGAIGIPLTTIFETAPVRSLASALPMEMGDLIMPWERLRAAGISAEEATNLIHAVDHSRGDARLVGAPAFVAVWERLPLPWSALPPLLTAMPMAMPLVDRLYRVWARHRLRISGAARSLSRGSACDASACEIKRPPPAS